LDQVRRLRDQLQAMSGPGGNRRSQTQAQAGKNGQSSDGRNPGVQNQARDGSQQQESQGSGHGQGQPRSGQQLSRNGSGQQPGGSSVIGNNSGDIRRGGGGYADGTAWNNINTGNNTYGSRGVVPPAPTDANGNPQDTEQSFQQQLSELGRLNQMVQGDPNLSKEVRDLTRRMQDLDPKRFPGNPAIVEQMHKEMLSSINRLEIELLNHGATGEARSGKPQSIPDGYQEAVADYYRRLSKPR
jgi:hypothetical protein